MNWDAVSAIAEIIGVLLIVASLAYVARQLSQNTAMMRARAASERLERDYELVLPLIESGEFADIWIKGDHEYGGLNESDQQRLLFFERRAISLWHHMFQLRAQNLLADSSWGEQVWVIRNIGRRQAVREAWRLFKGAFEPDFTEFVDDEFAKSDNDKSDS
jgi:hypothetical protein